jgi:uncharacterized BrkB/YihY/UPF0761 family membrane protein
MRVRRALLLWALVSVAWAAFLTFELTMNCVRDSRGRIWCPAWPGGDVGNYLTDVLLMIGIVGLGVPTIILGFASGVWFTLRIIRRIQRSG